MDRTGEPTPFGISGLILLGDMTPVSGVLRVDAIHQDLPFDKTMAAAVEDEIRDLAQWLELDLTLPG
jgi:hypothetical protein